ncbi:uncharacterized protein OCT59_003411 [Rhizophagus irregularis]|uniref:Uncharacterized protein n=2 Tax=Rhizophagus irregularis TaxID=588596 RepID=U9TV08_RHIID|nr:hypothetical protein GLOIN_2v1773379 [Rhizophagus irregularis DAOM 181602=DAOM 197198]EXX59501.1 hypothetical protein RirG_188480 [Rhizophagus irregularis DAOM 197198w]POG72740.1 hypothetical protein GLOIN_2v1773379 [Rhizophagus irregularis DAOM 181602=DAOM 197198]UZO11857.1 hypothetical protein OCT59_003411 [Rhizophagus irregularis]GBC37352.1 hypothetical protein GLOIN_2v1773379 [Rhizophagus irregularis DAOM 181602=DAOM 197198]|eukprot:XP_025179606.1 hypothetical protein GLOIN_2v1773379 [Rhizophagus irregularis DAOM 181602=DAOM 197198]
MRTSIYHDNIDNVSEILAKFFNKYTHSRIKDWCLTKNIIVDNNTNEVLRSKDYNFQRFVDAITSRDLDPTQITLISDVHTYEQFFPNDRTSLVAFMKFVLGLTYLLLDQSRNLHLEGFYPFIGITYFMYDKINHSSLLNSNLNNKSLILRDIRNLWSIFLSRKTNSHTNLNGEWNILIQETQHPVSTDSSGVDLSPAFNIIDGGTSRTSVPLSVYIQNSLIEALNDVINI